VKWDGDKEIWQGQRAVRKAAFKKCPKRLSYAGKKTVLIDMDELFEGWRLEAVSGPEAIERVALSCCLMAARAAFAIASRLSLAEKAFLQKERFELRRARLTDPAAPLKTRHAAKREEEICKGWERKMKTKRGYFFYFPWHTI
jgi:hypothetical protein